MKLWQSRYNPQCKLSQQDLLGISDAVTQAYSPHIIGHTPELVLMPVDPVNLYAYWDLHAHGTDQAVSDIDIPLVLRIYSLPEFSERPEGVKLRFDIRVDGLQSQQKVKLPVAAMAYSAIIGELKADNSFNTWAASEIIHVPRKNPVLEGNVKEPSTDMTETLENNFVTDADRVPDIAEDADAKTALESRSKRHEKALTVAQACVNETIVVNVKKVQPEACVLQNFNDYGYDLVVYQRSDTAEFKELLVNQVSHRQSGTKNITTANRQTSGLGLNLERP